MTSMQTRSIALKTDVKARVKNLQQQAAASSSSSSIQQQQHRCDTDITLPILIFGRGFDPILWTLFQNIKMNEFDYSIIFDCFVCGINRKESPQTSN